MDLKTLCPPVLEETECLVGPDSDQALHREGLQGPQGLEDPPYPPSHLSGGVDVMRLGVLGKTLLHRKRCGHKLTGNVWLQAKTPGGLLSELCNLPWAWTQKIQDVI